MQRIHRFTIAVIAGLVVALQHSLAAQGAEQNRDPAATVRAFWEAVFARRWPEAAELLDLTDVSRFRQAQLNASRRSRGRELTAADLMRRDPDMPKEAAEYEVHRLEKQRQQYPPRPFWMYYGVDSAAQLERMPLEEAATRWLQGHDPLWQVIEQRRVNRCPPAPSLDSLASSRRVIVYGSVAVGVDTAFVTFRAQWFPTAQWFPIIDLPLEFYAQLPQIAVLNNSPSGWHIRALPSLLEGQDGGMAQFGMQDCPARKP